MTDRKLLDQSGLPEGQVSIRVNEVVPLISIEAGDIIRLDLNTRFDHWIKVGTIQLEGMYYTVYPAHCDTTMFTLSIDKMVTRLRTQYWLPLKVEDVNPVLIEYMGNPLSEDEQLTPEECLLVIEHFCQSITPADLIPSIEALFKSGRLISRINPD